MARDDFTILVNLEDYFSDDRQRSKIYINRNYSKISDLEDKISEIFGIKLFHLLSDDHYLPSSEDIALLKNGETVSVKPNIYSSQSILLTDTYYDKADVIHKSILSEDVRTLNSEQRKNFSGDKKQVEGQAAALTVGEKKLKKKRRKEDLPNNNECRLHTSTPNSSNVSYIPDISKKKKQKNMGTIERHLSESNMKMKKLEKGNDNIDDMSFKLIKSKKRKYKELKEETSIEESSHQKRSEMKNQEFLKDDLRRCQPNLLKNHELKSNKTGIESHLIENKECFSQPIPYRKARNCKSWSTLPLPKTTNIIKIIKIPVEKIEIDHSRFVYTPNDSLPPLEHIDMEIKNKNNSAAELTENFPAESLNYSDQPQNFLDESQHNTQLIKSEKFSAESEQMVSPMSSETSKLDSPLIQSRDFSDILRMLHVRSQKYPDRYKLMKSWNCPKELKLINCLNSSDTLNQQSNLQNYPDKSQQNMELTKLQLKPMESESFPDVSQIINSDHIVVKQAPIVLGEYKEMKSQDILNTDSTSDESECSIELQATESQNCSLESHNFTDTLKQDTRSQSSLDNVNDGLIQSQNFSAKTKEIHSQNIQDVSQENKSQKSCEVSWQTNSQNFTELQQKKYQNSLESQMSSSDAGQKEPDLLTRMEQLKSLKGTSWLDLEDRILKLSETDMEELKKKSRERWRNKIDILTSLRINNSEYLKHSSSCHNSPSNEKLVTSETIVGVKKCKGFLNTNESETTNDDNKNSLEPDPMDGFGEHLLEQDRKASKEFMKTGDCISISGTKLSNGISGPSDDIPKDSAVPHEAITDNGEFPEPKRKRKRRYRKKKKVETPLPRQEKINVFSTKWVTFIPAKPKIHIKFDSSDDDISLEKNDLNETVNVTNNSATQREKIKILQDVTLDMNHHIDNAESKVSVESKDQDELTRCQKIGENCNNSGFSNDDNDYLERLLQKKKEELLRAVDSITSVN